MNQSLTPSSRTSRVAVLRANALGDYMFCIPALEAIKHAWPDAELVYLGNAWHRDFLAGRPGPVDRVEVIPRCNGIPHESDRVVNAEAVNAFFERMRAERFDIAFQMHGGGGNSNPFMRKLGARTTAGMTAEDAEPLDINIPYVLYRNEVLRNLEIVSTAGANPVSVNPAITVTGNDQEELGDAMSLSRSRQPFAVLHPGASDVRRRWPAEKVAAVADALAARNMDVYLTGVDAEADLCEEVASLAKTAPVNACGKLSLNALTALLSRAAIVVSNDTGPLHLARALGTRTVGTYWIGNVINSGLITGCGHRICMSWTTACPRCGIDCIRHDAHLPFDGCDHAVSFLGSIAVSNVLEAVDAALKERVTEGRPVGVSKRQRLSHAASAQHA